MTLNCTAKLDEIPPHRLYTMYLYRYAVVNVSIILYIYHMHTYTSCTLYVRVSWGVRVT